MTSETWLSQGDTVPLNDATPTVFAYFNIFGGGGGLAVFYKSGLKCHLVTPFF